MVSDRGKESTLSDPIAEELSHMGFIVVQAVRIGIDVVSHGKDARRRVEIDVSGGPALDAGPVAEVSDDGHPNGGRRRGSRGRGDPGGTEEEGATREGEGEKKKSVLKFHGTKYEMRRRHQGRRSL